MPATKISVDSVTAWRASQVALRENRSLANAVGILVGEAWDSRQATAVAKAMPIIREEAEPAAATVAAHMTGSRIRAINLIAAKERRSVSAVINLLVSEALASRAARPAA